MANMNIVLLGKTGHGKSSTGNTILREERFYVSSNAISYTKFVEREKKVIGEYKVQVFDTPGPRDTQYIYNTTGTSDIVKTCPLMESMIATGDVDGGVHAFFFVLAIGTRLTEEEISTIEILEDIFGYRVFYDFGVLVFTHGDNLQADFSKWCAQQDKQFKHLMAKFNDRVLMTVNTGTFSGRRLQCSENMIKKAAELQTLNRVYNLNNYKMSEKSRTHLLINSIKDVLTREFLGKINALEKEINNYNSIRTTIATFFFRKIDELSGEIKNASQGTNVLDGLYVDVKKLETLVESKKSFLSYFKCQIL